MPRYLALTDTSPGTPRTVHGILTGAAYKRLVVNGLPGLLADGSLAEGYAAQMDQALDNLVTLLTKAGLAREDLLRVTAFVTVPGMEGLTQIAASSRLGGMRPGVAIRQVVALSQAGHLIELDAEAMRES